MSALIVLVVEDDALIGMLLAEMLEDMGFSVCGSAANRSMGSAMQSDTRRRPLEPMYSRSASDAKPSELPKAGGTKSAASAVERWNDSDCRLPPLVLLFAEADDDDIAASVVSMRARWNLYAQIS